MSYIDINDPHAKTYAYDYDDYDNGKGPVSMVEEILADPDFPGLEYLVIGSWGSAYEDGCQEIIDGIVDHADRFSHITKLFIGNMDYEECEVSWIIQGNYSRLWAAMPQLKELTIMGSTDLDLGQIAHDNLESQGQGDAAGVPGEPGLFCGAPEHSHGVPGWHGVPAC